MYTPSFEILERLFITALNAAIKAGEEVLKIYNSGEDQITVKSDNSPYSLADGVAHKTIMKILSTTRIPVMSEEGRDMKYEERKNWDMFWLVDPLDGTRQFIKKTGFFTINIALIIDGYPVFGVTYAPEKEILYSGHIQQGSFKIAIKDLLSVIGQKSSAEYTLEDLTKTAQKLPLNKKRDNYIILVSENHTTNETKDYINCKKEKHPNLEVISIGSSLKMCILAEGGADEYIRHNDTYEWDTAAAQAILEGAGYSIKSLDTKERLRYNKESLINPWFICEENTSL